MQTAAQIITALDLTPHPEGGIFRETWCHDAGPDARGAGTAIYFLLRDRDRSHWHRVDADELWHFHAGAPLTLWRAPHASTAPDEAVLGVDLAAGEQPQLRVPASWWQAAESTRD